MRKTAVMLAGLVLAMGGVLAPATAQAPASGTGSLASATRLVGLMKVENVLDSMFQQITPLVTGNILATMDKAPDVPAALKARLANASTRVEAERIMNEEVLKGYRSHYSDVVAATARQYAASFSESDLQAAIAFYQSAAGQHFIAAQAGLQRAMSDEGRKIGMIAGQTAVPAAIARIIALPAPAK